MVKVHLKVLFCSNRSDWLPNDVAIETSSGELIDRSDLRLNNDQTIIEKESVLIRQGENLAMTRQC
jgi:hypothetical protein